MKATLRAHLDAIGVVALAAVVAALGAVEVFRPFGLRFSDLTGRVVTLGTMIRIGILTIVVVRLASAHWVPTARVSSRRWR